MDVRSGPMYWQMACNDTEYGYIDAFILTSIRSGNKVPLKNPADVKKPAGVSGLFAYNL